MKSFFQFIAEQQDRINDTRKTQVATTYGTYKKTGEFLKKHLGEKSKTISIGAGLDQTKRGLEDGLGEGHTIHDMEPNPQGRKKPPEFTSADEIPKGKYDAAVCHNVLNVVEPHIRHGVVKSIFDSLKEGGHAVIGVRKWAGDISTNKNFDPGEEEKSMWVKKKDSTSYQKGFDGNELKDYIQGEADKYGHEVEINRISGIAANGIHMVLKKKGSKPKKIR